MNERNPSPRELRALLQVLTVKEGFRSLGRLESADDIEFWERYSDSLGLKTFRYSVGNGDLLFVFKDGLSMEEVIRQHFEAGSGYGINNRFLGKLYGYPECCIDHFNENAEIMLESRDDELKLKTISESKTRYISPYVNNFIGGFISHLVCSYQCKRSLEIGERNAELIRSYSEDFHREAMNMVRGCLVLADERGTFIENGHLFFNDKEVRVRMPVEEGGDLEKFKDGDEYVIELSDESVRTFIFDLI